MTPRQQRAPRAITYARQSKARPDKSETSPETQRAMCRALIESRGWEHVGDYADIGRSGYDPSTARPGLDAALRALRDGKAERLIVYRLDRLTRRGAIEAVRLVGQIEAAGGALVSVHESYLDLSTPMGRGIFGLVAAMAEQESRNVSDRSRGAKATLRRAGSASGGRPIYGMRARRERRGGLMVRILEPDPHEAPILRDLVARVLAGESTRAIARDLNARRVRTKTGGEWGPSTLTRVLRSPSIGGYMPKARSGDEGPHIRDRRTEIERDPDTGERMQPWQGVIDGETFRRLQDVLDARVKPRGKATRTTLFGGFLLRCAECGGPMSGDMRPNGTGTYRCSRHRRGSARCSGTAVSLWHTENYLADAVFRRLAKLDPEHSERDADLLAAATERFAGRTDADSGRRDELRGIVADAVGALERLDDDRAAGLFDGDTGTARYRRQVRGLTERLEAARRDLDALAPSASLSALLDPELLSPDGSGDPMAPGGFWENLGTHERKREFLGLFLDRVKVNKPKHHNGGNAPFRGDERLTLEWAR